MMTVNGPSSIACSTCLCLFSCASAFRSASCSALACGVSTSARSPVPILLFFSAILRSKNAASAAQRSESEFRAGAPELRWWLCTSARLPRVAISDAGSWRFFTVCKAGAGSLMAIFGNVTERRGAILPAIGCLLARTRHPPRSTLPRLL